MKTSLNLAVLGIDHGHIFDMLDEMLKEGCTCNYFWTEGSPLTLKEFNKKYPNIKMRTHTVVSGIYDHGYVIANESITNYKEGENIPKERLWRIRAKKIVTATGAIEKPLVF